MKATHTKKMPSWIISRKAKLHPSHAIHSMPLHNFSSPIANSITLFKLYAQTNCPPPHIITNSYPSQPPPSHHNHTPHSLILPPNFFSFCYILHFIIPKSITFLFSLFSTRLTVPKCLLLLPPLLLLLTLNLIRMKSNTLLPNTLHTIQPHLLLSLIHI